MQITGYPAFSEEPCMELEELVYYVEKSAEHGVQGSGTGLGLMGQDSLWVLSTGYEVLGVSALNIQEIPRVRKMKS